MPAQNGTSACEKTATTGTVGQQAKEKTQIVEDEGNTTGDRGSIDGRLVYQFVLDQIAPNPDAELR